MYKAQPFTKKELGERLEWLLLFDQISIFPPFQFLETIDLFHESYYPYPLKWSSKRSGELWLDRKGVLGRVGNMIFYTLHILQSMFQNDMYLEPTFGSQFKILRIYTMMEKDYIEQSLLLQPMIRNIKEEGTEKDEVDRFLQERLISILVRFIHLVVQIASKKLPFTDVGRLWHRVLENTIKDVMENIDLYKNLGLTMAKLLHNLQFYKEQKSKLNMDKLDVIDSQLRLMKQKQLTHNKKLIHQLSNKIQGGQFQFQGLLSKEREIGQLITDYPDAFYIDPQLSDMQKRQQLINLKYKIKLMILQSKRSMTQTEIERRLGHWLVNIQ